MSSRRRDEQVDQLGLEEMRRQIDASRAAEDEVLDEDLGGGDAGSGDDDGDEDAVSKYEVSECFRLNERGDGQLFALLNRDRLLFVKTIGEWLVWAGHHWKIDKEDLSHNAVDLVAQRYEALIEEIDEKILEAETDEKISEVKRLNDVVKAYRGRIKKLRGLAGAKSCLEWAHKIGDKSLAVVGDEMDQKPWLLPCANGVIDLKTGKLHDGRPGDYLVKAIPIEWQGLEAPRPVWEQFIRDIHLGGDQVADFVRRLFGYSVTGLTSEHFIACFIGEGRNGKGTMFETLRAIMGDLSWSVQPELILEQKNARSSAGPSPDLVSLQGRRLVVASETDENRRISGAKVKWLTGSDTICARSPHDRFETNFAPTHKLFLYTNHVPKGLTRDYALVKRLLLIKYPLKFIDNPKAEDERKRDPDLPKKLLAEAPGILAWLVQGCLEWQQRGLDPPDQIRADVELLRKAEDNFGRFFDEFMAKSSTTIEIPFADIYTRYKGWYLEEVSESDRYIESKIKVSEMLEKRGGVRQRKGGSIKFSGLQFKAAP